MINYVRNICFFLSLGIFSSYSQHNLVVNPSFEEIDSCLDYNYSITRAFGWDTLRNRGGGTPDLFNECCLYPNICGVPYNWNNKGYQYPKSGAGYANFVAVTNHTSGVESREYIQGTLIDKLIQGREYCIYIYISLSEYSQYSCISVGVYLDDGSVSSPTTFGLAQATPQILNTGQQLDDTLNWVKIEGSFIASGTEEYITIGNFFSNSQSGMVHSYPNASPFYFKGAHYYIDDVSVIDQSTPAYAGNDTLISVGDSVFVGRTSEIGLNEACVWYTNGMATDTIAGMWVKPSQTTTYIVEQNLCGQIDRDTVTVSIGIAGLDEVQTQNGIRLYPNPSTGEVWINTDEQGAANIEILTLNGSLVYATEVLEIAGNTKLSVDLTNGVYLLVVKTNTKKYTNRIVVVH